MKSLSFSRNKLSLAIKAVLLSLASSGGFAGDVVEDGTNIIEISGYTNLVNAEDVELTSGGSNFDFNNFGTITSNTYDFVLGGPQPVSSAGVLDSSSQGVAVLISDDMRTFTNQGFITSSDFLTFDNELSGVLSFEGAVFGPPIRVESFVNNSTISALQGTEGLSYGISAVSFMNVEVGSFANGSLAVLSGVSNGLVARDTVFESFINNGHIGVTNSEDFAFSNGLLVDDDSALLDGLTNAFEVVVSATGDSSSAYGVALRNSYIEGDILNSGLIDVVSTSYSTGLDHSFIEQYGIVDNSIDGIIRATSGSLSSYSVGILFRDSTESDGLDNDGLIEALALGDFDFMTANGLELDQTSLLGYVSNEGTIRAEVDLRDDSGSAKAVVLRDSEIAGAFTNQAGGIIEASSGFRSYGIDIQGMTIGSFLNNGLIDVSSVDDVSYGLYVDGLDTQGGDVVNNGTISQQSNGGAVLYLKDSLIADVSNTAGGELLLTSSGGNSTGISVFNNSEINILENEGLIRLSGGSNAYGLDILSGSDIAELYNTGTIDVSGTTSASYGVRVSAAVLGDVSLGGSIDVESSSYAAGYSMFDAEAGFIEVQSTADINAFGNFAAYGLILNNSLTPYLNIQDGAQITADSATGSSTGALINGTYIEGFRNEGFVEAIGPNSTGVHLLRSYLVAGMANEATGTITAGGTGLKVSASSFESFSNFGEISGGLYSIDFDASDYPYLADLALFGYTPPPTTEIINEESGSLIGSVRINRAIANLTNHGLISLDRNGASFIAGDYTQSSTGMLRIVASSATDYSSLDVAGTASLASNAQIDVDVMTINTLADGDILEGVISAGTLVSDGTFNVTDNSALFDFVGVVDANDVDLTIEQIVDVEDVVEAVDPDSPSTDAARVLDEILARTPAAGAANAIDGIISEAPTGMAAMATELGQLETVEQVHAAVESVLPAITGGVAQLTNVSGNAFSDIINARQDFVRGMSSGDGFLTDGHLWLKAIGGQTNQDDTQGVVGYDIDTNGLAIGADGEISDNVTLGFAVGYFESDVSSELEAGKHKVKMNTLMGKVYTSLHRPKQTVINLQASVGITNYDSEREIFNGSEADSDYDGWNIQLRGELERGFDVTETVNFAPYGYMKYSYADVDGYKEKGAGVWNLDVESDTSESLILGFGLKGKYQPVDRIVLSADLGAGYDVMSDESNLTSSFSGGGAQFTTEGLELDSHVYTAGLEAKISLDSGVDISARYDLEARESYSDEMLSLKIKSPF